MRKAGSLTPAIATRDDVRVFPLPLPLPNEVAGRYDDRCRSLNYLTAVGSTTESAAFFDVFLRLKLITADQHSAAKGMLERVAAMLVKLAKAQGDE